MSLDPNLHSQAHNEGFIKSVSGWFDVLDVRPEIQPRRQRVVVKELNSRFIANNGSGMNGVLKHIAEIVVIHAKTKTILRTSEKQRPATDSGDHRRLHIVGIAVGDGQLEVEAPIRTRLRRVFLQIVLELEGEVVGALLRRRLEAG